jgi:hypothetical protein
MELRCPKCAKYFEVDVARYQVTCECGALLDIVSDSFFDGDGDCPMWYLEVAEQPTQV